MNSEKRELSIHISKAVSLIKDESKDLSNHTKIDIIVKKVCKEKKMNLSMIRKILGYDERKKKYYYIHAREK